MDPAGVSVSPYPTAVTVKFIETLKQHPIVYDMRLRYVESRSKQSAWKEVANTMQMSVRECMRRWRYLRDRYCRERKIVQQLDVEVDRDVGSLSLKPSAPMWPYYHHMAFLDPHIKHRLFHQKAFDVIGERDRDLFEAQERVASALLCSDSNSNDLQDAHEYIGAEDVVDDDHHRTVAHLGIKQEPHARSASVHRDGVNDANIATAAAAAATAAATAVLANGDDNEGDNVTRVNLHSTQPQGSTEDCSPSLRFRQELQCELLNVIRSTQRTINDIIRGQQLQWSVAEDENDLFGRTIAASLKTFSSAKRWQAKEGIIQLLMQLQSEA